MKRHGLCARIIMVCIVVLAAYATASAQQTGGSQKLQDIRKLIQLDGSLASLKQAPQQVISMIRQQMPDMPDQFWQSFVKEFDDKDMAEFTEQVVGIYDKYLTEDEVKDLLRFYETATGRKIAQVVPKISQEMTALGTALGSKVVQGVMSKMQVQPEQHEEK